MSRHQSRNPSPMPDRDSFRRLFEFLEDFKNQDESTDSKTLFQTFCNNQELQQSTFRLVQRDGQVSEDGTELLQVLCQFLLKMYRSTFSHRLSKNNFIPTSTANDMIRTRVVVLQYLPHFINLHLCSRFGGDRSRFKFVDAFLLAIYNTEASEQLSNKAVTATIANMPANPLIRPSVIKVPPLATSSTYHDSARLESEDKLDQRPSGLTFHFESWAFVDNLTASSRTRVLQLLLQTFNRHLVDMSKFGLDQFVKATSRILERGYGHKSIQPRVHMDSPVLQELLFGAYVCMYNGFQLASNQIVEPIHARASMSGCADVLLLSNAIKNLVLNSSPSQVSTSNVSTTPVMGKNIITNASFRAKKMHTDIPKVQIDAAIEEGNGSTVSGSSSTKQANLVSMASIVEEESAIVNISKNEEEKTTPGKNESSSNKGFNRDKFIAKLQLRKKTQSDDREAQFNSEPKTKSSSEKKEKKELKSEKKKQQHQQVKEKAERPDKLEMVSEITPLVNVHNGDQQSNNSKEYDTVEKVEELIQMHQLPTETVAIHSPESGTTIF